VYNETEGHDTTIRPKFCTTSLLNWLFIMTTAQCALLGAMRKENDSKELNSKPMHGYIEHFGSTKIAEDGIVEKLDKAFVHEGYQVRGASQPNLHDIGLLRFAKPLDKPE